MKTAVFDIGLAGCLNCKMAIEHAGRHIDGVKRIEVDIATHSINLTYDESETDVLEELKELVSKIGYEAKLVENKDMEGG
jgi:cation transport ATPase